ncbi:SDR family NAD(P)-dependent oxidoreductase [Stenotrophomonas indicatrix]
MGRLDNKVAIITGASRGIGRATAELFAAEGAKVAILSRSQEALNEVVAQITKSGGTALGVACDITDADQIIASVKVVVEAFGGVDILVNNAYDFSGGLSSVLDLSAEQLQRNFDLGPLASLRTMQACHPYLKTSGAGRVINFASLAGVLSLAGYAPYSMAKEAIRALTRSAAREWAQDGITVNSVLPLANTWGGEAPAPDNAMARFGSAKEDIAPVVLFLASQDAQFITGYGLTPDGGHLIDSAR